ncbi:MAG: porin family protein, partial [Alphaproteobacteria bacterium]|nr:porin family protein [Alphaproteobacteria bacterium]
DYSKYFGTELFFNLSNGNKRHTSGGDIKTSYRSYGLDLLAYLPLGCSQHFSLLGTMGAGEYVYKTTLMPAKHYNEHGIGYRFGGGFKYAVNKKWDFRIITRYVNFDKFERYDHTMEYSISAGYHF